MHGHNSERQLLLRGCNEIVLLSKSAWEFGGHGIKLS